MIPLGINSAASFPKSIDDLFSKTIFLMKKVINSYKLINNNSE